MTSTDFTWFNVRLLARNHSSTLVDFGSSGTHTFTEPSPNGVCLVGSFREFEGTVSVKLYGVRDSKCWYAWKVISS